MKDNSIHLVLRVAVAALATSLFVLWTLFHITDWLSVQNGIIRLCLGVSLCLWILLRKKTAAWARPSVGMTLAAAIPGAALALVGLILRVRQFEWIGVLALLYGCLRWALPGRYGRDTALAFLLLYWVHPLPTQLFTAFQLWMQRMSVSGAEWLLHVANTRVWADGLVLRTGVRTFDVPAWCSGMRTATTVFLLSIGMGILRRMRPHAIALLTVAAVLQALLLNIVRIAAMVVLAPAVSDRGGLDFLHDTAGIVVILAVLILYAQLLAIDRVRLAYARHLQSPDRVRRQAELPVAWWLLHEYKWVLLGIVPVVAAIVILAHRSRAAHRVAMVKDVAIALREFGDLANAQRAADHVRGLVPEDLDWHYAVVRLLLLRGRYQAVLDELDAMPEEAEGSTQRRILSAYALMGLERIEDAAAIVRAMPEEARRDDPRIAMILAEIALYADQPDEVAQHIVTAARWRPNLPRIRALYPYLRMHGKWQTIVSTDLGIPFDDPAQAFAAIEAYMNLNRFPAVSRMTLNALRKWPDDPRLMEPLFFLCARWYNDEWERRFATHLLQTVRDTADPDQIYGLIARCFQLSRPDLVWRICERLREVDPSHPGVLMALAQHGQKWFVFRRQRVGFPFRRPDDLIDLRALYRLGLDLPGWRDHCAKVPFAGRLLRGNVVRERKRCLADALERFASREETSGLTLPLQYLLVRALEMDDDVDGARRRLASIAQEFPDERKKTRVILSEIHEREADWSGVYEVLRDYPSVEDAQLTPLLRLCRAQLRLHLGIAATRTAREAVRRYPLSTRAAGMLVESALRYDSPEQALFLAREKLPRRDVDLDRLQAEALLRTERYREFSTFCERALLPRGMVPAGAQQRRLLPPAEWSVYWHHAAVPTEAGFRAAADTLRRNRGRTDSPFLHHLVDRWLACYASDAGGESADADAWQAGGRDRVEKGILLHQLVLLLCRSKQYLAARDVAGVAVKHLPECGSLWRALVSLSRADPEVMQAARRNCPDDPDIWLAELCARTQDEPGGEGEAWALAEIRQAAERKAFSAATMTRAGEYLLRREMTAPAAEAARDAVRRARGLLPAYVLGVKCALAEQNREWALECIAQAINASIAPWPLLFRTQVMLKIAGERIDTDAQMVEALKQLREADPQNMIWPRILGYVRFHRGGWEVIDALEQMTIVLAAGGEDRLPYLIAGEAARVLGNCERSVGILREGLKTYPDDLVLLNNLAYSLSLQPGGAAQAMQYLPRLLKEGGTDLHVLDTAITLCMRSGETGMAEQLIGQALKLAPAGSPLWFRAHLSQAGLLLGRDEVERAHGIVRDLLKQSRGIPDEDIMRANRLFYKVEEARFELEQAGQDSN